MAAAVAIPGQKQVLGGGVDGCARCLHGFSAAAGAVAVAGEVAGGGGAAVDL